MDIKNNNLPIQNGNLPTQNGNLLTIKQLERNIYQQFSALYRQKTGASLQRTNCTIFKNYLVIVAEEALSPLEATMRNSGEVKLLKDMRLSIDKVITSELQKLIQEIAKVDIIDLTCGLNISTARVMAVALLDKVPEVRLKNNKNSINQAIVAD